MHAKLVASGLVLGLTAVAFADEAGDELSQQVQELRELVESQQQRMSEQDVEISRLHGDGWLTEQRADQIRSLVHDVLADADTRASLLQGGMTAGYQDGFYVGSADGNFMLRIGGQMQIRYTYSYNDDDPQVASQDERS